MTETVGAASAAGLSAYRHARTEGAPGAPLVLTFHGTGGDEHQLHALGADLIPGAHVISPLGDVSEGGHARFFRRRAEGVYDMEDLARAVAKMAGFVAAAKAATGTDRTIGIGFSNGANILAATALAHPEAVDETVLMHPLVPWGPAPQPGLAGKRALITAGRRDPIAPAVQTDALARYLERQGVETALHWHEGGHGVDPSEIEAIRAFLA